MFNKPIHSFDNRTVLVVGASSGIGFEIAKALEILGENLIVTARRADILEANFSQNTRIPVDIADEEAMGKFFELIRKKNLDIDRDQTVRLVRKLPNFELSSRCFGGLKILAVYGSYILWSPYFRARIR